MWAKGWAVGNVYSRCPRASPAPSRRIVHLSIDLMGSVSIADANAILQLALNIAIGRGIPCVGIGQGDVEEAVRTVFA